MLNFLKKSIKSIFKSTSIVDSEANGELFFLENVIRQASEPVVVFDVGANKGDYSELVLRLAKQYGKVIHLHIFEPQLHNFNLLKEKFGTPDTIHINHFALSDEEGTLPIFTESKGSALGSLYNREFFKEQGYTLQEENISLITAESYIRSKQITKIDYLKIDVEGHEYKVVNGLGSYLDAGSLKINNIQFEYGGTYKDAGIKLKDVFGLLSHHYNLGKISNTSCEITPYNDNLEDYKYSNYLATLKN